MIEIETFNATSGFGDTTSRLLARFPEHARETCLDFCKVMDYELTLTEWPPCPSALTDKDGTRFGFSLYPPTFSRNEGMPARVSQLMRFDRLVESVTKAVADITTKLGETETSIRMKAQLRGISA